MNSSGKVLTIFMVIIAILLISLTAISLFFFQKETDRRKIAEIAIEEIRTEKAKIESDLKEIKKQNFLLQEKNKEADERINDLTDELELEKGLREEMKREASALKEQHERIAKEKESYVKEIQEKTELQRKLNADLSASEQKIKELETKLKTEIERGQKLGQMYEQQKEAVVPPVEAKVSSLNIPGFSAVEEAEVAEASVLDPEGAGRVLSLGVELGKIVVVPDDGKPRKISVKDAPQAVVEAMEPSAGQPSLSGRILSVDAETEFVIVNLGRKDGISEGQVLSVYRGSEYLGDITITRLQPEMSAADLIPPFTVKNVQKNDQVKLP